MNDLEEQKQGEGRKSNPFESSFREVSIRFIAGTIDKDEVQRFKRILFRATIGKSHIFKLNIGNRQSPLVL
jgi:hypothetical protein